MGQRDKARASQKWDFFLSQINYVNNSSLSRDVSNNFRSNLSNKLQVNDIPERRKSLILRALPQIFIETKRTRSYLAIWTYFGVTMSKTQNKKKSRTCVPNISPYLLHKLKLFFTFEMTFSRSGAIVRTTHLIWRVTRELVQTLEW